MATAQDSYGLVVGGYRVKFTNYSHESFFANKEDAQEYLIRFLAYGYEGIVETIHLHVKKGN
jgi:hypothetical protein